MGRNCNTNHLSEFRTDEDCEHTQEHLGSRDLELQERSRERQTHQDFLKLSRMPKMYRGHLDDLEGQTARVAEKRPSRVQNEQRAFKLLNTAGHDCAGILPEPRPIEVLCTRGESVRVMPSQDNHGRQGMRSCSRKLAAAEFYSRQYHQGRLGGGKRGGGGRSSAVVDEVALAELMRELGI